MFQLTSFLSSIILWNIISKGFCCYNSKEGMFLIFLEKNLFLRFFWFYYNIDLNLFYESYLPLSTLFLISFLNILIKNQLSASTATVIVPVLRDNRKLLKMFLYFDYFYVSIFIRSLYESYLLLSTLFLIYYFKHLIQNQLSSDTATVHVKDVFEVYLEYYWGIHFCKNKIHYLNMGLLFILRN